MPERREGRKTKYSFNRENGEPLFLAGLYLRSSEMPTPCFTILTRDAADSTKGIHARMPVILSADRMMDWLSPESDYRKLLVDTVTDVRTVTA